MVMLRDFINSINFVLEHPLTRDRRGSAFLRVLLWQIGARLLRQPILFGWVNNTRLIVERGMAGATGNYYCGLHEFNDMGFLLHYLTPGELFVDIGANVGTYTVLAAGAAGADVVSFEPIPSTFNHLVDNINVNGLTNLVRMHNVGLSSQPGVLRFSAGLDAENHVISADESTLMDVTMVPVVGLDDTLGERRPKMIKMDVEGYETEVISGGEVTFGAEQLEVVLIELNGAGVRYGFEESAIRMHFEKLGFKPCHYDPYSRGLQIIDDKEASKSGNTLYVKNVEVVQAKVLSSKPFRVLGEMI
jgi:FkbM family methyltransferase